MRPGIRSAGRMRGTRAFGRGVRIRNAGKSARFVYGIRRERVSYVAVATPAAAKSRRVLAANLRLAGLR